MIAGTGVVAFRVWCFSAKLGTKLEMVLGGRTGGCVQRRNLQALYKSLGARAHASAVVVRQPRTERRVQCRRWPFISVPARRSTSASVAHAALANGSTLRSEHSCASRTP